MSKQRVALFAGTLVIATSFVLTWPSLYLFLFTKQVHISDTEGAVECRAHRFIDEPRASAECFPRDGTLVVIAGRFEGPYRWYWPDGSPRLLGQWHRGLPAGLWHEYSQSGDLVRAFEFVVPGSPATAVNEGGG